MGACHHALLAEPVAVDLPSVSLPPASAWLRLTATTEGVLQTTCCSPPPSPLRLHALHEDVLGLVDLRGDVARAARVRVVEDEEAAVAVADARGFCRLPAPQAGQGDAASLTIPGAPSMTPTTLT